jgi:hypothetical protein
MNKHGVITDVRVEYGFTFDCGSADIKGNAVTLHRPKGFDAVDKFRVVAQLRPEALFSTVVAELCEPHLGLAIVEPGKIPMSELTWQNLMAVSPEAVATLVREFCRMIDLRA